MFAKISRAPEVPNPREPRAADREPGAALPGDSSEQVSRETGPGEQPEQRPARPWPEPTREAQRSLPRSGRARPGGPGAAAAPGARQPQRHRARAPGTGGCEDEGAGGRSPGLSPRVSAAVLPSTSPAMAAAQEVHHGRAEPSRRRLASATRPALPFRPFPLRARAGQRGPLLPAALTPGAVPPYPRTLQDSRLPDIYLHHAFEMCIPLKESCRSYFLL